MDIVDLSEPLYNGMAVYPGDHKFKLEKTVDIEAGGYNLSCLHMSLHTGTHLDFPLHFIKSGEDAWKFGIDRFIGRVFVCDIKPGALMQIDIDPEILSGVRQGDILIIHTGWDKMTGDKEYYTTHPYLTEDAIDTLIKLPVKAVGFDFPSPDRPGSGFPAHKKILGKGILIYENLKNVSLLIGKEYVFHGVPQNIKGAEGSTVRAYAVCEKNH